MNEKKNQVLATQVASDIEYICSNITIPDNEWLQQKISAEVEIINIIFLNPEQYTSYWLRKLSDKNKKEFFLPKWAKDNFMDSRNNRMLFISTVTDIVKIFVKLLKSKLDDINEDDLHNLGQMLVRDSWPFFFRTILERLFNQILNEINEDNILGVQQHHINIFKSSVSIVKQVRKPQATDILYNILQSIDRETGYYILSKYLIELNKRSNILEDDTLKIKSTDFNDKDEYKLFLESEVEKKFNYLEEIYSQKERIKKEQKEEVIENFIIEINKKLSLSKCYIIKRDMIDNIIQKGWQPEENWQRFFINIINAFLNLMNTLNVKPFPENALKEDIIDWNKTLYKKIHSRFPEHNIPDDIHKKIKILEPGFMLDGKLIIPPKIVPA